MSAVFDRVYEIVRQIPPGKVAYYGQIAAMLGMPRAARMVGTALSQCPSGSGTPCHRVVDKTGGTKPTFDDFAPGTQRHMLEAEGVAFLPNGRVDMARHLWQGMQEKE